MICGPITTLALTATLLGNQRLKVEERRQDASIQVCDYEDSTNANAKIELKDSNGHSIFVRHVRLADMKFYETPMQRGVVPLKRSTFLFTYPLTSQTKSAVTVKVTALEGTFVQSARLTPVRQVPMLRIR